MAGRVQVPCLALATVGEEGIAENTAATGAERASPEPPRARPTTARKQWEGLDLGMSPDSSHRLRGGMLPAEIEEERPAGVRKGAATFAIRMISDRR